MLRPTCCVTSGESLHLSKLCFLISELALIITNQNSHAILRTSATEAGNLMRQIVGSLSLQSPQLLLLLLKNGRWELMEGEREAINPSPPSYGQGPGL